MIWIEYPKDRAKYCNCCNAPKDGVMDIHVSVKDNRNSSAVTSLCEKCRKDLIKILVNVM